MSDSHDPTAEETDLETRRVCSLLQTVAKQYPSGSPESNAIADAAEAFILVHQHQALKGTYRRLKAAHGSELDNEINAKLRSVGIDPSDFDGMEL